METSEKDLYAPLKRLAEREGYTVEGAAVGRAFVLPYTMQTVDLIGFRWKRGGDVDAWAIEAKRGGSHSSIRAALAQALAYQAVVPHVSIATGAYKDGFETLRPALCALGIGYVRATSHEANQWECAGSARTHDRELFDRTVRHASVLRLLADVPRLGELGRAWRSHAGPSRSGSAKGRWRDYSGGWGFATHTVEPVQIMLHVSSTDGNAVASVWVESKEALRCIFRAERATIRDSLPSRFVGAVSARPRSWTRLGEPKKVWEFRSGGRNFEDAFNQARRILRHDDWRAYTPVLNLTVPLWRGGDRPDRWKARRALDRALDDLLPVRAALRSLLPERLQRRS